MARKTKGMARKPKGMASLSNPGSDIRGAKEQPRRLGFLAEVVVPFDRLGGLLPLDLDWFKACCDDCYRFVWKVVPLARSGRRT